MRESIRQFVKICAETLPISEPIYEFGSFQVPGQEGFADIRPLFPGKKYIGADMREGPGVDVILNLHNIDLPTNSVGTVLVLDTLEHVEFVRKAIEEVHRILKPNGILIVSSVLNFPIHDYPFDYWRFTPEGFRSLLKPFTQSLVDFAGESDFPHTVVGVGFKSPVPDSTTREFVRKLQDWKEEYLSPHGRSWKSFLIPFIPPLLLHFYFKKLRRA
jgi:SAM-dependent methyltransferase